MNVKPFMTGKTFKTVQQSKNWARTPQSWLKENGWMMQFRSTTCWFFFFYLISVFYYEMTGCHRNLFLLDFLYIFVHLFNFVWHRVAFHMQLFHFIHQLVSSPNCKKISLFISMTNLGCWYFKSLILHTRKCTFHYHVSISVNRAQY